MAFLEMDEGKNMPDLPKKKVGIVACSGEELPEGTATRLAALKVLEQLRPADTVTICLPLFLAGGEGDRAFARFHPTIAVDGCDKRCAARATEMYSGKPAASVVVSDLVAEHELERPEGERRLNDAGQRAVEVTAERVADLVDDLLGRPAGHRAEVSEPEEEETVVATCSCGSGIPVQKISVNGRVVTLIALPAAFQQLHQAGKRPGDDVARELLEVVKIYNPIPREEEDAYRKTLLREYAVFCEKQEAPA
jgi:uncharacterized metal-binding protein